MITIFTPIYNRKYIIHELYQSLQRQTCYDFEWIIIDDGSTDGVYDLLQEWENAEKRFNIIVECVPNGGKHRAINRGVNLASGDAFFIVDSDDYISDDAVELIHKWWDSICNDNHFAGVSGLKAHKDSRVIGDITKFEDYVDATNLERAQYGLLGDKAEVYRTDILRRYPFPEFEDENFITEEVVWNRIAYDGLKIRWFNKAIYFCEYLEDGLTKSGKAIFEQNPRGWARHIHDSNVYGYWQKDIVMNASFDFFETNYEIFDIEEMQDLLGLSNEEMLDLENRYNYIKEQFQNIMKEHNCKSVAIYGVGNYGRRALRYFKSLGINIKYLIDQKLEKYDSYIIKRMSDDFEDVDCICLALKNVEENLKSEVRNKFSDSYVWSLVEEIEQF